MIKNINFIVVVLFLLISAVDSKGANIVEGGGKRPSGDFGINRRVKSVTTANLVGVSGHLSWALETPTTTIEDAFFNATEKNPLNGNAYSELLQRIISEVLGLVKSMLDYNIIVIRSSMTVGQFSRMVGEHLYVMDKWKREL